MQGQTGTQRFIHSGGWLLAILAFALRLAYILAAKSNPTFWAPAVDPFWYDEAATLFAGGSLGDLPFFRAPLYPALLGAVYYFFGHSLLAARILSTLLQSVAVWALFRMSYRHFSPLVAWIAAGILALSGMAIYFSGEILSTSLELLIAICALWATLHVLSNPTRLASALCGLSWGLAIITRPNFLVILPVVLFFLWKKRQKFSKLLIWAFAVLLPILPVTLTNIIGGGEFVLLATQGGVNFWIGNNPEATGMHSSLPGIGTNWTMQDAEEIAASETGRKLRPGELSDFYYKKAFHFIAAHPWAEARLLLRKTLLFLNRFEISNNKHLSYFMALAPWLPPLRHLGFGFLIPFALVGVWVTRKKVQTQFLLGFVLFYSASVILFFLAARFRLPIVPALCLFTALAIEWLWQTFKNRAALRQLSPLLLLIPGIIVTQINPWQLRESPEGWAHYMEGNAYMNLGETDKAEAAFREALNDVVCLPLAHVNLGVIAYRRGDIAEAENQYQLALADDSLCVKAWNNLGIVNESRGDTVQAILAYRHALKIRPYAEDARMNLAGLYFRQGTRALREGQDAQAVYSFRGSIELATDRAATHYNLAVALGRLGQQQEAIHALEIALTIEPTFAPARELMQQLRTSP